MAAVSSRAQYIQSKSSFLAEAWLRQKKDAYHPERNPNGVINFGTSENKLVEDIVIEKASTVDIRSIPTEYTHYCEFSGLPEFRKVLAKFMTRYMKTREPVDWNNLAVLVGVGSVVECLGFCLFDQGDGILIPAPYYGAFHTDLVARAGVVPISVPLSSEWRPDFGETGPFQLSIQRIMETYKDCLTKGVKVRGLLITNPNNPLGVIYTGDFIKECMDFCHQHQLHIIIDEVYLLSIFGAGSSAKMKCALSFESIPDPDRTHVLWGFSKDFAVSGFRCGVLHSWNKQLMSCIDRVSYLASVPTVTQCILKPIVEDFEWLDCKYIPVYQRRLREVQELARNEFQKAGIYCLPAEAGLFCWIDLRRYLKSPTFEAEQDLFERLFQNKVYITPTQGFFGSEPGWFRVVIACDQEIVKAGLGRIFAALKGLESGHKCESETEDLSSLVKQFQHEVRSSDWLDENTAEKWQEQNPEVAKAFLAELEKHDMRPSDLNEF